ncbi:MAG: hypothetical protein JWQ11_4803 [Rhizobacter sp.]|nr:hypothetical protein [Rhizobacter sp.]
MRVSPSISSPFQRSPSVDSTDLKATPTTGASSKPAVSAATGLRLDQLIASLGWPKENHALVRRALDDLVMEFAASKPDLSNRKNLGISLGEVIKADPKFAVAALKLFAELHFSGGKNAAAVYQALKEVVPAEAVAASPVEVRAAMNAFSLPLHAPRSY